MLLILSIFHLIKLQCSSLYMHKLHTAYFEDLNKPEQWGFASKIAPLYSTVTSDRPAENQITPFNFTTPDDETLYAWHVMPLGLYAKHEKEIIKQPSGLVEDIRDTKAFDLLSSDPQARLIISCEYSFSCQINVAILIYHSPRGQ